MMLVTFSKGTVRHLHARVPEIFLPVEFGKRHFDHQNWENLIQSETLNELNCQ